MRRNIIWSLLVVGIVVASAYASPVRSMLGANDNTEFVPAPMPFIEATDGYIPYLFDENPKSVAALTVEMEFSVAEPFMRWCFVSNAGYREVINSSGLMRIDGTYVKPEAGRHYLLTDMRIDPYSCFCDGIPNSFSGFWPLSAANETHPIGIFNLFNNTGPTVYNKMPKRIYWMRWSTKDGEVVHDLVPTEDGFYDMVVGELLPVYGGKNAFIYGVEEVE